MVVGQLLQLLLVMLLPLLTVGQSRSCLVLLAVVMVLGTPPQAVLGAECLVEVVLLLMVAAPEVVAWLLP